MRTDSVWSSPTISDTPSREDAAHTAHPSSPHHIHRFFGFSHSHSTMRTDSIGSTASDNPSIHSTQPTGEDAHTANTSGSHHTHRLFGFGHLHSPARSDSVRSSSPNSGDQHHRLPSAVRIDSIRPSSPDLGDRNHQLPSTMQTANIHPSSPDSRSPSYPVPSTVGTESIRSNSPDSGSPNDLMHSATRTESLCASPTSLGGLNHRNVLIVGDVGVGKSSLVNLISDKVLADTSSGVKSCTLQSREYTITLDDVTFTLHDTAGLHEAREHMGNKEYLNAVYQAYTLISRLEQSGGISLLVFCMKAGRVSNTTQQTYNLFVEVFCRLRVPVVIVVTHVETYDCMEQWWNENEEYIREYGLRSHGHACITTTRGYKGMHSDKYELSKGVIRKLLLEHSCRVAWKEEKASWVKRMMLHMRNWLSPRDVKQLKGRDLRRKLTKQCGFSPEDADLVAQRMKETRGMSQEDVPEEGKSVFDEKFGSDNNSCVSLPVVPYTS